MKFRNLSKGKVSNNGISNCKESYLHDKPGIRKKAESKKLWVVCDASAKSEIGFSLNDCLEKGQPLQYKLWNVLVRSRFHSVTLCADIEKAFLQIRIRESERDCLRFHWFEVTNNDKIKIYHFARFVFGLTQSF